MEKMGGGDERRGGEVGGRWVGEESERGGGGGEKGGGGGEEERKDEGPVANSGAFPLSTADRVWPAEGAAAGERASAPYLRLHPPSAMIAPTRPVPSATMMNPAFQLP